MAATLEQVRGEGVWRGRQWEVAGAECGERGGLLSGSGRETAILGPISPQPTLTSVTSGQGMGGRHQLRGGAQPGPPAQPAGLRQPRERLLEVATGVVGIVWNGGEGGRNLLVFFNPVMMSRQVWGGGLGDRQEERLGFRARWEQGRVRHLIAPHTPLPSPMCVVHAGVGAAGHAGVPEGSCAVHCHRDGPARARHRGAQEE